MINLLCVCVYVIVYTLIYHYLDNKENSGLKSVPDKEPLSKDDGFDYDLNLMSESEDSDAEMKESNKSAESASENLTDVPDTEKQTVEKGGENSGEKARI